MKESLSHSSSADVVFLMDSSTDVSAPIFLREKAFVKNLARTLKIDTGGSRGAVVAFGESSILIVDLNSYRSPEQFRLFVDRARYIGGDRRMDRALEEAAKVKGTVIQKNNLYLLFF